ncbi:MAG TPA: neprosin family prolyl endopeptidase [Bryobacteraceae bacterium]
MPFYPRRQPLGLIPHDAYLRITSDASLRQFQHHPNVRVAGATAFREMQEYILAHNAQIDVVHSFEDAAGQIFDCVPIEQQPSLRGKQQTIHTPRDLTALSRNGRADQGHLPLAKDFNSAALDRHGNPRQAPSGTIPMRRVRLEDLIRFENLRSFFRKHPNAAVASAAITRTRPTAPSPDERQNHRYAVGFQSIGNIGGHSAVSVYGPSVNSNEIFSLAQHWYSGGSGANLQTVEVGWQAFPKHYGVASPCLFIFWTADAYQTGGAYNLEQPGFVQVNSNVQIGGARDATVQSGVAPEEMEITVYLIAGEGWWLYLDGLDSNAAVGYYPISLFGSGQMATSADQIEYGGETVSGDPPSGDWGAMGSGAWANDGWQAAAYHRAVWYWDTTGASNWASLNEFTPASPCYTFNGGFDSTGSWGTYFFFGGPGGGDC